MDSRARLLPAVRRAVPGAGAAFAALLLSCGAMADPTAADLRLRCAIERTTTGTSGTIQKQNLRETIELADGVYRVWSPLTGWGENLCALASCRFVGGVFTYGSDSRSSQGGYDLRRVETLTFERGTGLLESKRESTTTLVVTGFARETTVYEHGRCAPSP